VCVKFSKFDHGFRLSHPLGAAVARLAKSGERGRRRGMAVIPLVGLSGFKLPAATSPFCAPSRFACRDKCELRARLHGSPHITLEPNADSSQRWEKYARHRCAEKLGMRPHQRHGAAGRLAGLKPALGDWRTIPNLFANEAGRSGHPRHHAEIGQRIAATLQLEMTPFARQQRPSPADPGAVIVPLCGARRSVVATCIRCQ
jgi:hypothetical protein